MRLFSRRSTVPEQETDEGGVLIHAETHRCEPPDSLWIDWNESYAVLGERVRTGDKWVCRGCTAVWRCDHGHWIKESDGTRA